MQGRLTVAEREAYRLGRLGFERGDAEAALARLSGLLRTRPRFADVHYMVGVLLEARGDYEGAAESLREALRINPSYCEAALALASVYERQGDFRRCRSVAERLQSLQRPSDGALDPTTRGKLANLQAALGDAYREAGELRQGIEAYRKALDRCPGYHDIRYRLAIALREAGLPHKAIEELKRVLRARPGYLDAAVQLGLSYYTLGRSEEAAREWQAVLQREPSREDVRIYLRMVRPNGNA